jgi:hypothetical protein
MLRCQAQLELTLGMCFNDHSTSTGALSDCSTFTSTDARATDFATVLVGLLSSKGVCVCKSLSSLPPNLFMVSEPGTG